MSERSERMSSTAGTSDIVCPFFFAHCKTAIRCADIYPGSRYITTEYASEAEKNFQEDVYCKSEYKKCWLYDMAMKLQWEEAED